jgi:myo-inositol catabolism protein IolS
MKYRKLGTTDIEVSTSAMGCMSLADGMTYPTLAEEQAIATVHAALEAGINLFDTAAAYGNGESERMLGNALKGRRGDAVIATKISASSDLTADSVRRDCEQSLERLQTDYIDLYQIHWPRRVVPITETMRALEGLVQAGKVRAIGVCNFGPLDLVDLLETSHCQSNQVIYSLLARGVEFELRELCLEKKIGLLCYSPLAQGLLTGRFSAADEVPVDRARTRHFSKTRPKARHNEPGCERETFAAIAQIRQISAEIGEPMADVALAWLLHQPVVTSVLTGASRPEQIRQNARAAGIVLSPEVLRRLEAATDPVKQKMGSNLDIWQSESRMR